MAPSPDSRQPEPALNIVADPGRPASSGTSAFPGVPFPLGATPDDRGTNFSVVADTADGVDLCLLAAGGEEMRLPMQEQTYGAWHTYVPGVRPGQRYGYRVTSRDAEKILLDPYARRVDSITYDLLAAAGQGTETLGKVPLGIVTERIRTTTSRPEVPWEHTIIYEAHVKGLTKLHPGLPANLRGTFAGVAHPAVIDHLKRLGVTTLQLLPVHAHATEPELVATGRQNYWGYSTLSYFAVQPTFASTPGGELTQFVAMVDALHTAGIELILDVVYNHTCEGGPTLPVTLSWRGLAPGTYYLPNGADITGTGNTLNSGPQPVVRMVTDSLRYFADELGVDGFRFDLCSVLGRPGGGGFNPDSALLTAIAVDPLLSRTKLIAEPWDATGEGYAVGRFGASWAEWNDHYRGTVRDFWRGASGVRDLGYRLSGSQDLYGYNRRPFASVNFVTAHDGFTLRDLLSYDAKHNQANGENNRDGSDDNRSANYGAEGETADADIIDLRARQARNILGTLLLSTGTPMMTMGDEVWRTQNGNNNAYCQDNATNWVDWSGVLDATGAAVTGTPAADLLAFAQRTAAVRSEASSLHQGEYFEGRAPAGGDEVADLVWFGPNGAVMTTGDWFDDGRRTLQMWIDGKDVRGHSPTGAPLSDDSWLLMFHAGATPIEIVLPGAPYGLAYVPVIDTATPTGAPADETPLTPGTPISVPGRTLWLLRAYRDDD